MLNKKATAIREVLQTVGSRGRIFGVTFTKADGSTRKMTARLGVTKYLKGTGTRISTKPENLVVFDMSIREYRTVPLNSVFEIRSKAV